MIRDHTLSPHSQLISIPKKKKKNQHEGAGTYSS